MTKTKAGTLINPLFNRKNNTKTSGYGHPESPEQPHLTLVPNENEKASVASSPSPHQAAGAPEITITSEDSSGFELEVSGIPPATPPALAPEISISMSLTEEGPLNENTKLKIQPSQRKTPPQMENPLILWESQRLQFSQDPLARGLTLLIESGTSSSLFLAVSAATPESPAPLFIGAAAVNPKDRIFLWKGLKWDPRIVPEVWNYFIKSGYVEFPPPGTMTNVMSHRNVVRAAFGVEQEEWLSLLRVGDLIACRGILAVISSKSLQEVLPQALALVGTTPLRK